MPGTTTFDLQNALKKTLQAIANTAIISEAEAACDHLEDRLCEFSMYADNALSKARDDIRIRKDIRQARIEAQRSCQGCGWKIRNDLAPDGARERTRYCITCDPVGVREFSALGL